MQPSAALTEFVTERHLAVLATQRADGTPHAVPVGFTYLDGVARVITSSGSVKVSNVRGHGWAAVTQIDGRRWVTLEGPARVLDDAEAVELAVGLYEQRYRPPRENAQRVVIEIEVQRVMTNSGLR